MGSIRAPIKLLDNFQICLGIVAAYGLDHLLCAGKGVKPARILWIVSAAFAGFMLLAGLKLLAFPANQKAMFTQMGFDNTANVMIRNMANGWFHGALFALILAALVFVVWKGFKLAKWVSAAFIIALAADSLMLTSHYFDSTDIAALKNGNVVVNFIKGNQGNERTFFADSGGIYNQWLASDGPYHGLNLFNVWQMSRMPGDYKEFLGTVGRNQIRLWELASIKYVAAPASILQQLSQNPELGKQFKTVLKYQVPTAQGMRDDVLLQFMNSIPRFALFSGWESVPLESQCQTLASPGHNARATVLLDAASDVGNQSSTGLFQPLDANVTKRSASLSVKADAKSVLRFSQYYQPGWKVFIDGKVANLLRVDYLCMGVIVPPGEHTVEFRCASGAAKAILALGVFTVSLAGSLWLLRVAKKR